MLKDKSVINRIFKNVFFTQEEIELLAKKFQKISVKKNDVILDVGDITNYLYFVDSGCLRVFLRDKLGKEHTIEFAITDWWSSDFTSFYTMSKSTVTIECIQSSVLYGVHKEDLDFLHSRIPILESFYRSKLEGAYSSLQKRTLGNLSKSAKERYIDFITNYPDIVKCIKNYHIASYLGIATETLSRIRKEIARN